MSLLSDNLKFLRKNKGASQQATADVLSVARSTYQSYETEKSEPPIDLLRRLSSHYGISIDVLVSVDLHNIDPSKPLTVDGNTVLLPMRDDRKVGRNTIIVIPHSAKAGYLAGYSDPEYIEGFQRLTIPFFGPGNFRAFPIEGNSMPPYDEGTHIIGRLVERSQEIKAGRTYVFVTLNDGLTYKRVQELCPDKIVLRSDNPEYSDFYLSYDEIVEAWAFQASINTSDIGRDYFSPDLIELFRNIKEEISLLERKL